MASPPKGASKATSLFSLEDQFTFYASYHSNRINKAIHLLCIWPILWTTLALATRCPLGIKLPPGVLEFLPLREDAWNIHAGTPVVLVYIVVYLAMDLFAGGLASLLVVASYMTSNMWMADGGSAMLAGGVNVAAWIAQFYGHGVHEGRAPALLDNLFQAFLAAPLFVLCEVLFEFGYKKDMQKRMKAKALLNVQEFQATKSRQAAEKRD
eukprot:jgi/Undpi1/7083/HiC_scaffold_22.g09557.m1